jgi:hypothetical protein
MILPLHRSGELKTITTINDWGGLLNSEQNPERSVATEADQGYAAGKIAVIHNLICSFLFLILHF